MKRKIRGIAYVASALLMTITGQAAEVQPLLPSATWNFDNASFNPNYGGLTGTASGAPGFSTENPFGATGNQSLSLSDPDFVAFGSRDFNLIRGEPFSASFWIRSTDADGMVLGKQVQSPDFTGSADFRGWYIAQRNGGIEVSVRQDHPNDLISANTAGGTIDDSGTVWNHVLVTYDGTRNASAGINVYINGSNAGVSFTGDGPIDSLDTDQLFAIGSRNGSGSIRPLDGLVDEIAIWRGVQLNSDNAEWLANSGNSVAALSAGVTAATPIAHDAFLTGGSPPAGEYTVGALASTSPQNPTVTGFSGAWQNGTTATGIWTVESDGLDHPTAAGEAGGRVQYSGFDGGIRRVERDLATYAGSPDGVYWLSGQLRLDGNTDTTGTIVAGFVQDNTLTDGQFFDSAAAAGLQGLMWGFQGDGSEIDLILRHRQDLNPAIGNDGVVMANDVLLDGVTPGEVISILLKLEMNSEGTITTGNDLVSVWLNQEPVDDESLLPAADATFIDFSLAEIFNLQQLVFAADGFDNQASFDEMRLGLTLQSVLPTAAAVPEPATAAIWIVIGMVALVFGRGRTRKLGAR